jgi:hypothetical protein
MRASEDRRAALATFYGLAPEDLAPSVVLTPIPALFARAAAWGEPLRRGAGWWPAATVASPAGPVTVLQHPEGARVVDAVLALEGLATRIALLGLCGSLRPELPVGTLVAVEAAHPQDLGPAVQPHAPVPGGTATPVRSAHVDGFLVEDAPLLAACRRAGVDVLDMETQPFYAAGASVRPRPELLSLLVVTDEPGTRPFWSVALGDGDLEHAAQLMLDEIRPWFARAQRAPTLTPAGKVEHD